MIPIIFSHMGTIKMLARAPARYQIGIRYTCRQQHVKTRNLFITYGSLGFMKMRVPANEPLLRCKTNRTTTPTLLTGILYNIHDFSVY